MLPPVFCSLSGVILL